MVEQGITVTVRDKNAVEWIRNKVQSGTFTSEADVVEHGIAVIREEDSDLEDWLRNVVADRYERHQQHPETAIPAEQVTVALETRRKRRAQGLPVIFDPEALDDLDAIEEYLALRFYPRNAENIFRGSSRLAMASAWLRTGVIPATTSDSESAL